MDKKNGLKMLSVQFVAPTKNETQIIMRFIFEKTSGNEEKRINWLNE